jgi:hypothetical protein
VKLSVLASICLLCAACAEPGESGPAKVTAQEEATVALTAEDKPKAEIAPFEANGLPGQAAVEEAIGKKCGANAPEIRQVSCVGFEEESTEFSCEFEFQSDAGKWEQSAITIAIDGQIGWLDIGGPECEIAAKTVSE